MSNWAKTALCIIGLIVLLVGGNITFFSHRGYVETTAVITKIEEVPRINAEDTNDHKVYVQYEVDGQTYEQASDHYQFDYSVGKEIRIYYDPNNPTIISGSSNVAGIVFMAFGGVIILVSGILMLTNKKTKQPQNREVCNER